VNEEGTKAAAATLAMVEFTCAIMERKVLCADHAFIYWIQHLPSQQVLFVGTVCNPSSQVEIQKQNLFFLKHSSQKIIE
jgi:serine protease inhibitor